MDNSQYQYIDTPLACSNDDPNSDTFKKKIENLKNVKILTDYELMLTISLSFGKTITKEQFFQILYNFSDNNDLITKHNEDTNDIEEIKEITGFSGTEAAALLSALEFAQRRSVLTTARGMLTSKDVFQRIRHYAYDENREHFIVLALNRNREVIGEKLLAIGNSEYVSFDTKDILSFCLQKKATGLIVAHNHPSSNLCPCPSKQDLIETNSLYMACSLIDLQLLDHLIFDERNYYSLKDNNQLFNQEVQEEVNKILTSYLSL